MDEVKMTAITNVTMSCPQYPGPEMNEIPHTRPPTFLFNQTKIQWKLAISIHDRLFSVFYFFQRHTLSLIATHTHTHRDTDTQTHSHCQCTNVNN